MTLVGHPQALQPVWGANLRGGGVGAGDPRLKCHSDLETVFPGESTKIYFQQTGCL